jgi:hypothetical protein
LTKFLTLLGEQACYAPRCSQTSEEEATTADEKEKKRRGEEGRGKQDILPYFSLLERQK